MSNEPLPSPHDSVRELLRQRDYMLYLGARLLGVLATAAQSVTMGWQIYELARAERSIAESALYVGLLGLATFLPLFFLALPAGVIADRYPRKRILIYCFLGEALCATALVVTSWSGHLTAPLLLLIAVWFGVARAFRAPAGSALAPMLVPESLLPRAIAWSSLAFQVGAIFGPALAGFLVAHWSSTGSYLVSLILYLVPVAALLRLQHSTQPAPHVGSPLARVREGLAYIRTNRIVLGAISLDLCAVLLGGATALLPVFARDVLHVGAEGFGLLRSAPAVGAAVVAFVLASRPVRRKAGASMFGAVALFGAATIVFALSRSLLLSLASLFVLGGADMVSVYIRQTLIQIVTPDPMRGRVASVSYLFIGASNELGEFESGLTARVLGPALAALFGGIGSLTVTALWTRLFPSLRSVDRLEAMPPP